MCFPDANSSDLLAWIDGHAVVNISIYQHWDSNFPRTDQKRYDCGLVTRTGKVFAYHSRTVDLQGLT